MELLARYASGSLRDAVNALDRITAAYGDLVTEGQARENLGLNMDQRALDLSTVSYTHLTLPTKA